MVTFSLFCPGIRWCHCRARPSKRGLLQRQHPHHAASQRQPDSECFLSHNILLNESAYLYFKQMPFLSSVMDIRQRCWGVRWWRRRTGWRQWKLKHKPSVVWVISENNKRKKKLFTHISFLIAPLKHSANETLCWKELCKEINKIKLKHSFQCRFGQVVKQETLHSFRLFVLAFPFVQFQL